MLMRPDGAPAPGIVRALVSLLARSCMLAVLLLGIAFAQDGAGGASDGGSGGAADGGGDSGSAGNAGAATGQDVAKPELDSAQQVQAFHVLAPNDYLRITLTAGETLSYDRTVDDNGDITLPYLESVHVAGLLLSQAQGLLQTRYEVIYKSPVIDLLLLAIGKMNVLVVYPTGLSDIRSLSNGATLTDLLGDVVGGGLQYRYVTVLRGGIEFYRRMTQQAPPVQSSGVVQYAPGSEEEGTGEPPAAPDSVPISPPPSSGVLQSHSFLATNGSRLSSLLETPGVHVFSADIAELLRGGRMDLYNMQMEHGDVIFLTNTPPTASTTALPEASAVPSTRLVRVSGVPRAGLYALVPGEGLRKLLELSGFTEDPSYDLRNVLIERRDGQGALRRLVVDIDPATGGGERLDEVPLQHRDSVRILGYVNKIFVLGEVTTAGTVDYASALKVQDYLSMAQGPKDTANLRDVRIIRQKRDFGIATQQPEVYRVDVIAEANGTPQENYSIQPGDVIFVPHKNRKFELRDVTGSLNTIFLGLNFFQDSSNTVTNPQPNPGA